MNRAARSRFGIFAALLILVVIAGLLSLPALQRCCSDPPLPAGWPEPPNRHLLDRVFAMDMAPRLAALAVVAGIVSLVALAGVYVATAKLERREAEGLSPGYTGLIRAVGATFVVSVLYFYSFFITGYFQLGWFNLVWIIGVPAVLAALTGRDSFERRWGGLFLIVPSFVIQMALMMALGIGLY